MSEFEGKVVAITGAGGGLGKAHALEFAKRGARVVVNDLGGAVDGGGASDAADAVVKEITDAGGTAIANKASVSDREGAKSIITDAVDAFGTIGPQDPVFPDADPGIFIDRFRGEGFPWIRFGHEAVSRLAAFGILLF